MYKDYKDRYDFDMFYKRFVKKENVKDIHRQYFDFCNIVLPENWI